MKIENIYWNYTYRSKERIEAWKNGKMVFPTGNDEFEDFSKFDLLDTGQYSSLERAIEGFINEKCNTFSTIYVKAFDEDETKFMLTAEAWWNYGATPINTVVYKKWQNGEIPAVKHVMIEAIFIKHDIHQGSIDEFNKIMRKFPEIKIKKE